MGDFFFPLLFRRSTIGLLGFSQLLLFLLVFRVCPWPLVTVVRSSSATFEQFQNSPPDEKILQSPPPSFSLYQGNPNLFTSFLPVRDQECRKGRPHPPQPIWPSHFLVETSAGKMFSSLLSSFFSVFSCDFSDRE